MTEPKSSITLPDRAMRQPEVAALLGVSLSTVQRDVRDGLLPVVRRGCRCTLVYPSALAAYLLRLDGRISRVKRTTVEVSCRPS